MQANIRSLEALAVLKSSLGPLANRSLAAVDGAAATFKLRLDRLREREVAALRALESCRAARDGADEDDDLGRLDDDVSEAEDRLNAIRESNDALERRLDQLLRQGSTYRDAVDTTSGRAVAFLADKLGDLHAYRAVTFDAQSGSGAGVGATSAPDAATTAVTRPALPRGFVWIEFKDIDLSRDLENIQFSKVPQDVMERGLRRLKTDVLTQPAAARPGARDFFRAQDQQAGQDYEGGLQRVYEAFFGDQDYVYLERGRADRQFSITNGRHRVKVARDLGWDAIPAQVKDLKQ